MKSRKFLISIYKLVSLVYNFIFGRFVTQKINHILFSLSLSAKGYNNYGSFSKTGEKTFIKLIANDLQLCFDIGANIGRYSILLAEETNSDIVAFEPLEEAYKILQKNSSRFSDRMKVFNIALGEKESLEYINFSDEKSEKATFLNEYDKLSFFETKNKKQKLVRIFTLDDFVLQNSNIIKNDIDFIKIDTEGYELEVIKGSKKVIEQYQPKYIQIEFNIHQLFKNHTIYEFSKYLKNYELFQILPFGNKLLKVNPAKAETNIFHLTNFVYIRRDISNKFI
tara:strand:- start:118 stop:960 length:843 start_codon:yes stop_codon:yes gene_type:complete